MGWFGWKSFRRQMEYGDSSQQLGIDLTWYWVPVLIGIAVSILVLVISLANGGRTDE